MKPSNSSPTPDYKALRTQARNLIVLDGKSQKETAAALGVSRRTIGEWSRQGDWRDDRRNLLKAGGRADSLSAFIEYAKQQHSKALLSSSELIPILSTHSAYLSTLTNGNQ